MTTKRAFYLVFALPLTVAATAFAAEGDMHHGSGSMGDMSGMHGSGMHDSGMHGSGSMGDMSGMHESGMKHGNAAVQTLTTTGTVKKVHADKNMLTIAHEPVPELEWPAMTMGFKATDEQIQQVQEGDKIKFEFTSEGMNNSIVSISKD